MKDDYVLGACLYVTGAAGGWETFEHLGTVVPRLMEFQAETTADPSAATPIPPLGV